MFCKKCGNELPENAKFCGNCGSKTSNVKDENKRTQILKSIIIFIVIILAIVIINKFISSTKNDLVSSNNIGILNSSEEMNKNINKRVSAEAKEKGVECYFISDVPDEKVYLYVKDNKVIEMVLLQKTGCTSKEEYEEEYMKENKEKYGINTYEEAKRYWSEVEYLEDVNLIEELGLDLSFNLYVDGQKIKDKSYGKSSEHRNVVDIYHDYFEDSVTLQLYIRNDNLMTMLKDDFVKDIEMDFNDFNSILEGLLSQRNSRYYFEKVY